MLFTRVIGNLASFDATGVELDFLYLEWYEMPRRILRRSTMSGRDVSLRLGKEVVALAEGDILYAGEGMAIVVSVLSCDVVVIRVGGWQEAAAVCYEIGNRHLPLFVDGDDLLVPYDAPLMRQLQAGGYDCRKEERKLLRALRTTVAAHGHSGEGLLSKILHRTNPGL